ncbi:MAG: class I adenylate-forming enzyme family protein [Pseudomonadota bacterium]
MLGERSGFQDLVLFETTVDQIFSRAVASWPDREFIVSDGRTISYGEMAALVDSVAQGLLALDVKPGDRVALWMSNVWEWVAIQFAATRIGAVLTPLNTRLRVEDLRYTLSDSGARVLLTQAGSLEFSYVDVIREILQDRGSVPALQHVVVARSATAGEPPFLAWNDFLARGAADPRPFTPATDPDALAYILYTSGTTSRPKGVMLSHANLNNSLRMAHDLRDGDCTFLIYPLFAITGCHNAMLPTCLVGGSIILQERFDAAEAVDLIERHRCTVIGCIIYILEELLKVPGFSAERVSSLRLANVFPRRPYHRELLEKFGLEAAATGYGMTETSGPVVYAVDLDPESMLGEGVAWADVLVRTVLPDGSDAPSGGEGEIIVKGRQVMLGYFNLPEATANIIDRDGWLHTGDVGFFDEKKRLTWLGRNSDMYKCSGFNVSSQEVEAFLGRHPAVMEVAVLGVPDAAKGEVGAAFIVVKPGTTVDRSDIARFCSGKIASYKIPGHVFVRDGLPKTASGKVRKVELKAAFAAGDATVAKVHRDNHGN